MKRTLLVVGALLATWGARRVPEALAPGAFVPEPAPSLGEPASDFEARRWLRIEVPAGSTLEAFMQRYHLTARTYVCRRECRGPDLRQSECATVAGAMWVAAGDPEPREGPPCADVR